MARAEVEPQRDDLDALFEVDQGMDDIFDTVRRDQAAEKNGARALQNEVQYGRKRTDAANDVDEEIKITKKRAPIAKLDDTRLLSDNGILKLQNISKTKFKFKGKGHEFSDVARLLRTYQLWLDDLYPRAKFIDGLTIIEKLGHSKRMQVQRKAWIEAGKPKESEDGGGDAAADDDEEQEDASRLEPEHDGDIVRAGSESSTASIDPFNMGLDRSKVSEGQRNQEAGQNGENERRDQIEPDDDELDALLAEEPFSNEAPSNATKPAQQRPPSPKEPSFDDDEEAMRDMDDMW